MLRRNNKDIELIISDSLKKLSTSDCYAFRDVIDKKYFITKVQYPWDTRPLILVDTTRKITHDYDKFVDYSLYLAKFMLPKIKADKTQNYKKPAKDFYIR